MTPNRPSVSPSRTRPWRGIAALMIGLALTPAAFADEPAAQAHQAAPAAAVAAPAPAAADTTALPAATDAQPADDAAAEPVVETGFGLGHDLSPWGMFQNADIIVKIVMIGLAIASIITWTIWIAKGFELLGAKRRLRG